MYSFVSGVILLLSLISALVQLHENDSEIAGINFCIVLALVGIGQAILSLNDSIKRK